jgi:hypothetical protein
MVVFLENEESIPRHYMVQTFSSKLTVTGGTQLPEKPRYSGQIALKPRMGINIHFRTLRFERGACECGLYESVRERGAEQGQENTYARNNPLPISPRAVCQQAKRILKITSVISCKVYRNIPELSGALTGDEVPFRVLCPCIQLLLPSFGIQQVNSSPDSDVTIS